MKYLLIGLTLWVTLSHARVLDSIALVVEGLPVTTSEIAKVQRTLHVDKQAAIDLLIQDRLQQAAMKNIVVTPEQVDAEIAKIAASNHLSVAELQRALKQQGTPWARYRKHIETQLKQRRFFQQKIAPTLPRPSDETLQRFYKANKERFAFPARIRAVRYSAPSKEALSRHPHKKTVTLQTSELNPELVMRLLQTPKGKLSEPIDAGGKYVAYQVLSFSGKSYPPFETIKDRVAGYWLMQQRERAIKDYFKKRKTEAHIRYVRH